MVASETEHRTMDVVQAVVLGVVQGLTEFLPVSSSGHLVLGQQLLGLNEPELLFDISVHVGTLVAVIIFFRRDVARLISAAWRLAGMLLRPVGLRKRVLADEQVRLGLLIVLGSVPTAIVGLALNQFAEQLFTSARLVGVALLATGGLLITTRLGQPPSRNGRPLTAGRVLAIGLAQGLAVIPGISRSGTTIAVAMHLGIDRESAARFSFLLSIPAITGAALLGARDLTALPPETLGILLAGTAAAGVVGYLALWMLVYLVRKGNLYLFSPYCIALGLAALVLA
jgi:undecaprenyl-diphosphatase